MSEEKAVSLTAIDERTALMATESGKLYKIGNLKEAAGKQTFDEIPLPGAATGAPPADETAWAAQIKDLQEQNNKLLEAGDLLRENWEAAEAREKELTKQLAASGEDLSEAIEAIEALKTKLAEVTAGEPDAETPVAKKKVASKKKVSAKKSS